MSVAAFLALGNRGARSTIQRERRVAHGPVQPERRGAKGEGGPFGASPKARENSPAPAGGGGCQAMASTDAPAGVGGGWGFGSAGGGRHGGPHRATHRPLSPFPTSSGPSHCRTARKGEAEISAPTSTGGAEVDLGTSAPRRSEPTGPSVVPRVCALFGRVTVVTRVSFRASWPTADRTPEPIEKMSFRVVSQPRLAPLQAPQRASVSVTRTDFVGARVGSGLVASIAGE